jgi:5-(carboxyamino)imidazole ribonucleotide synthase
MLAQAAADLGLHTHIYCPSQNAPAFETAKAHTIAAFDDKKALLNFASTCDVVTFEFENIPLQTADFVATATPLYPTRQALEISQDRGDEKTFLNGLNIAIADWWPVNNADDLARSLEICGGPALLKTRRFGYDGKGQLAVNQASDPLEAFGQLGEQPAILEKLIPFECEISVVLARDQKGDVRCYDIPRNHHQGGILRHSTIPSGLSRELEQKARTIATTIATALDYTGVIAIELFVTRDHESPLLIVNEFAPRVHNTGHWTLDGCLCNQFENHIRAIAGWPLGTTDRHSDAKMSNLLGTDILEWSALAEQPDLALHFYGKQGVKPGRKLGHMTQISPKTN